MLTTDFYTRLADKGVIQIDGPEAVKYLQGQVTADVNQLQADNALLACHCDFKGKTWSVSYLFCWRENLLLLCHNSVLEKSLSELKKYGVFAKVNIEDGRNKWLVSGGMGAATEAEIIRIFGHLPEEHQATVQNEHGVVIALIDNARRYLIVQPDKTSQPFSVDVDPNGPVLWEIEDIKAGIAEVQAPTSNEFVPQMMNLQQLGAISFTKGCYMGQEVVARTKYLGKNKRAAFRLYSEHSLSVQAGEQLEIQMGENWRPAGTVLRAASHKGQTWLLAVLASDTEIGSSMRLKNAPEQIVTVLPQPYALS